MNDRKFSFLVHGESGVGKSRLADTVPGPRLLLDAEGGAAEWTPSPKVFWDPATPLPTEGITTDTTVVVIVRDWETVKRAFIVLNSGQHYFESVIWDSITEIQTVCKKALKAGGDMTEQRWGKLLDEMEDAIKEWRDLRVHPVKRVNSIFTAISYNKDGRWKADLQGALGRKLPGWVDLIGYLFTHLEQSGIRRTMAIQPAGPYDAKDRTDILTQRFGYAIPDPDMRTVSAVLNGEL